MLPYTIIKFGMVIMFSRNRLDIGWTDLLFGLYVSLTGRWNESKQIELNISGITDFRFDLFENEII